MKTLTKEVAFGKAVARITVTMKEVQRRTEGFEGIDLGTEVKEKVKIEIVAPNGKVVTEDNVAVATGYNAVFADRFTSGGFDTKGKITMVGQATTAGGETANEINATIKEMKEELAVEFGIKTKEQIEQEEKVEVAKEVVRLAEKEGIENLMTNSEHAKWRKKYNDLHNEGGQGYIPTRISKEKYEHAVKTLKGVE